MSISIRSIRIHVDTARGPVHYRETFDDQLIVIHGANTKGKSLLLQAILYGLAMDSLFATRKGTLTRAVNETVDIGDETESVIGSWIELEIANQRGRTLTVRRDVKPPSGNSSDTDLVRTWGDSFAESDDISSRPTSADYFAIRGGSATLERGFHTFLASFLGWTLPQVSTYEDKSVQLYLQVIFGLAYVDQKHGWGGIVPQVPKIYQIVEPLRRAVEFSLNLDVLTAARARQQLDDRWRTLVNTEARLRGRLEAASELHGGRVRFARLPYNLRSIEALEALVAEESSADVLVGSQWIALADRMSQLREARRDRAVRHVVGDPSSTARPIQDLEDELAQAELELRTKSAALQDLNNNEELVDMQLGALDRRLKAIEQEASRYGQLATLRNLGAELAPHALDDGDCPTCRQSLDGIESIEGGSLPIDATRNALKADRDTVLSLLNEAQHRVQQFAARRNAWSHEIGEVRQKVRAIKTDLVASDGQPSAFDIQVALREEAEMTRLSEYQAKLAEDLSEWSAKRTELVETARAIMTTAAVGLSGEDARKVAAWSGYMNRLLAYFGFESAVPDEVELDESMKPTIDGYDIGFQGSASDGIRLRWAYLLGLFAISTTISGSNHPGFLMFDEPGQQGVEQESLARFFQSAASLDRQVFVTTSEPLANVSAWLEGRPFKLIDLQNDRLLQLAQRD